MTTEPKPTSPIREFLFRPHPRKPLPGPKWLGPVLLIGMSLVLVGMVFESVVGSRILDPSTGHIHQIYFAKGGYRYVAFWQYIVIDGMTISGFSLVGIVVIVQLL